MKSILNPIMTFFPGWKLSGVGPSSISYRHTIWVFSQLCWNGSGYRASQPLKVIYYIALFFFFWFLSFRWFRCSRVRQLWQWKSGFGELKNHSEKTSVSTISHKSNSNEGISFSDWFNFWIYVRQKFGPLNSSKIYIMQERGTKEVINVKLIKNRLDTLFFHSFL